MLLTLIVSGVLYLLQRGRKRLMLYVMSHERVIAPIVEPYSSRVTVLFDGQAIDAASLAIVRIVNVGNVPVISKDFESPFHLQFEHDSQILEAVPIIDSGSLLCVPAIVDNTVTIAPLLLNPSDRVTVRILRRGSPCNVNATARIAGVRKLIHFHELEEDTFRKSDKFLLFINPLSFLAVGVLSVSMFTEWRFTNYVGTMALILSVAFLTIGIGSTYFIRTMQDRATSVLGRRGR